MTLYVQPRIAPRPTPASAGYVIYDSEETAIYGAGASVDDAWEQVMDLCERPRNFFTGEPVSDDEWFEDFRVRGATAALIAQVESEGGNIAWGYLAGVACTVGELVDESGATDAQLMTASARGEDARSLSVEEL